MPFLLAEILNFQGSTHHIGVGSFSKLDENIQKVSSVWSGEASASYLKRYQADKANLAQLTQILQQMGAALGEFSNSYTQADNKAMDLVHKYLGK